MQLKPEEFESVEKLVNKAICDALPVQTRLTSIENAKAEGAMALFEAKYGEDVRLIDIKDFSKELCGGTHVKNTSEIGVFRIVKDGAIAQGIRRIEAVSGDSAIEFDELKNIEEQKAKDAALEREKGKEEEKRQIAEASSMAETLIAKAELINEIKLVTKEFSGFRSSALKALAENISKSSGSTISVFLSVTDDKISILSAVTPDLVAKKHNAGNIVKELAVLAGGKGGGRPDFAEAGAKLTPDQDKAEIVAILFKKAKEILSR